MTEQNEKMPELSEVFAELEEIAGKLEDREISLEDSFKLYQKGMELLKECSSRIDLVEKKMLQMNGDGSFSEF